MIINMIFLLVLLFTSCKSLSISWSNRLGSTLAQYDQGIFAAERPFVWNRIDVGGRSVIIKMKNGSLFVHSPVAITPDLKQALKNIGRVEHVVSPNYEHVKYAKAWAEEYPEAKRYACPGLSSMMPDVAWYGELTDKQATKTLEKEFDIIHLDCETNPVTQKPFFNEVIFYHRPSKALLTTDIYWNYPESSLPNHSGESNTGSYISDQRNNLLRQLPSVPVPFSTQLWKFAMDKAYVPIYQNVLVGKSGTKRDKYNQIVQRILSLDIDTILPCHGDVIKGNKLCNRLLREFF